MSDRKETDFFVAEHNYDRGQRWYENRFPDDTQARGECSPNYTKAHLFSGVASRMHDTVPNARLIYLVRDPIERTISHYVGSRANGREDRSFQEAVATHDSNYIETSRYFRQLRPYMEAYPAEQICVQSLEELAGRPESVLRDLQRFIGVDPSVTDEQLRQGRFNTSARKRQRGTWFQTLRSLFSQPVKDRLRPYVPRHWIPGTPVARPNPSEVLRNELEEIFRDDVRALREWTGQEFAHWSL